MNESKREEKLHQLHHDVGHCLYVISMATEILKNVRGDDRKFNEVCETIENERRRAVDLLGEILKLH